MTETKGFCLKINVNSWHYKLNKFVWGKHWDERRDWGSNEWKPININLCPYARRTLAALVFGLYLRLGVSAINKIDFSNRVDESKVIESINEKFEKIPSMPSMSYNTEQKLLKCVAYSVIGLLILGVAALIIYEPEIAMIVGIVVGSVGLIVIVLRKTVPIVEKWNNQRPIKYKAYTYSPPREYPRWNSFKKQVRETCSLTYAYIHAKHKNICPCLQRVDE